MLPAPETVISLIQIDARAPSLIRTPVAPSLPRRRATSTADVLC